MFSRPPTAPQPEVSTFTVEEPLVPEPTPTLLIEGPIAPIQVVKKKKTSSKKKKK